MAIDRLDMTPLTDALREVRLMPQIGHVVGCHASTVESDGPDAFIGEICEIFGLTGHQAIKAEVIGFRDKTTLLMPYGSLHGVKPGADVLATGLLPHIPVGDALLGRVIDSAGVPIDGKGAIVTETRQPLHASAPNPVERERIRDIFETGVRVIDLCATMGIGQRMGLFSGSGVGKSTLLGMIAANSKSDVNVVALIGERGREVREFIEEHLGEALSRSVVVVATADQPALMRRQAALAAMSIAEHFRDRGSNVLLLLDSITRLAMAQREIGLAAGEPPTARGYTPSVFSSFPGLLERAGRGRPGSGSITAILTVLVEGDDFNEPIADHARAILDGHIVLSRELAHRGQFPAIDPLRSISRLARALCPEAEQNVVDRCLQLLSLHEESKDLVNFGAHKPGVNPKLDFALKVVPQITELFQQRVSERAPRAESIHSLRQLVGAAP